MLCFVTGCAGFIDDMADRLVGKNAIITGASRGLGAHCPDALSRGCQSVLFASSETDLANLRAEFATTGRAGQQAHHF